MADNNANLHGPGDDVIDPAGPLLGWLGIVLLVLMLAVAAFLLSVGAYGG